MRFQELERWPGYRVGDDGSVWSRHRVGPPYGLVEAWHRMKPTMNNRGYMTVILRQNGKPRTCQVHRLVLEAFVGPCPDGHEACHWPNPDRANCRLENLRWDTRKANVADAIRQGRHAMGSRNGHAKLTEALVTEIRQRVASGEKQKDLAVEFGVSRSTICQVHKQRTWQAYGRLPLVIRRNGQIVERIEPGVDK